MEIFAYSVQVVFLEVLIAGWTLGELLLHDRNQVTKDLIHLITSKQVGHLRQIMHSECHLSIKVQVSKVQ